MQIHPLRPVVRQFRDENRSTSGLPTVAVPLPPGHWMDQQVYYNRQEQRNTVDTLDAVGWPPLSRQPGTPVAQLLPGAE
jgi:hypothetical protein